MYLLFDGNVQSYNFLFHSQYWHGLLVSKCIIIDLPLSDIYSGPNQLQSLQKNEDYQTVKYEATLNLYTEE